MKIAITTDDWETISAQFISTKGFAIFKVEGTNIKSMEYRTINITAHERRINSGLQRFNRYAIIQNILKDCDVVITYVLEEQIIKDLKKLDINVYQTEETNVKNAFDLFLRNNLTNKSEKGYNHKH